MEASQLSELQTTRQVHYMLIIFKHVINFVHQSFLGLIIYNDNEMTHCYFLLNSALSMLLALDSGIHT